MRGWLLPVSVFWVGWVCGVAGVDRQASLRLVVTFEMASDNKVVNGLVHCGEAVRAAAGPGAGGSL